MTAALDRAQLLALVDHARRAPSVHNIQPARWRLDGEGRLELHADPARRLPVADPSGHDVRVSLGAALEGMTMALARRGMAAVASVDAFAPAAAAGGRIARLQIQDGGAPDPLGAAVARRATWRGNFAAAPPAALDALEREAASSGDVLVREPERIRDLAKLSDEASDEFLLDPAYWRETWTWLRLSRSNPGWDRDGLNAEALALSPVEQWLGAALMRPAAFEWMRRLGLARALTSERSKVESASALLLFTAAEGVDPLATGRAFYRRWLQVTAAGLALCPMSVLADSKRANQEIRTAFGVAPTRRLVNVLRIGAPPGGLPAALTPRLPAAELILDSAV